MQPGIECLLWGMAITFGAIGAVIALAVWTAPNRPGRSERAQRVGDWLDKHGPDFE